MHWHAILLIVSHAYTCKTLLWNLFGGLSWVGRVSLRYLLSLSELEWRGVSLWYLVLFGSGRIDHSIFFWVGWGVGGGVESI